MSNIDAMIEWVEHNYATKPGQEDEHIGHLIRELRELSVANTMNVNAQMSAIRRHRLELEAAQVKARTDFADELTRKGVYLFDIHAIRRYAKEAPHGDV